MKPEPFSLIPALLTLLYAMLGQALVEHTMPYLRQLWQGRPFTVAEGWSQLLIVGIVLVLAVSGGCLMRALVSGSVSLTKPGSPKK